MTAARRIARIEAHRPPPRESGGIDHRAELRRCFDEMADRSPVNATHYPRAELADALGGALDRLETEMADLDLAIAATVSGTFPAWCSSPVARARHVQSLGARRSMHDKAAEMLTSCRDAVLADLDHAPTPIPEGATHIQRLDNMSIMELLSLFWAPKETQ